MPEIDALLRRAASGPAALIFEGEAGIGKTTRWLEAVDRARAGGIRVLAARGAPSELTLTYSGLADLLSELDEDPSAGLPEPQQEALRRVLVSGGFGRPLDERAVAAAFLAVLERLAADGRLLIAVDDAGWLDPATRTVLGYAVRRLTGPVAILATVRTGPGVDQLDWLQLRRPDLLQRHTVRPMTLGGMHQMFTGRLGRTFPRPTMTRVYQISGGNPLYALELGRGLAAGNLSPNQLPDSLTAVVRERIGQLDERIAEILLTVAAEAQPRVEVIADAMGATVEELTKDLEPVESQGIVEFDGSTVRFTHPLLNAGVYSSATPSQRRAAHRRLAAAVNSIELRARHLAKASTGADPDTLMALDFAAAATAAQGAPATAAELVELAISLGGDQPMRRVLCATHHLVAGDAETAHRMLEPAIGGFPPGLPRSAGLLLLGGLSVYTEGFNAALAWVRQGIAETEDPPVLAQLHMMLAFILIGISEFDEAGESLAVAGDLAEYLDSDELRSQALSLSAMLSCRRGDGVCEDTRRLALELEAPDAATPIIFRASGNELQLRAWTGDLPGAVESFERLWQKAEHRGAEAELMFLAVQGTLIRAWSGDFAAAVALARDATERAQQLGGQTSRLVAAVALAGALAHAGEVEQTRRAVAEALEMADRTGTPVLAKVPIADQGFLEVSLGNYREAMDALGPLVADFLAHGQITEIHTAAHVPDTIEALVALGRVDEAATLVEAMEIGGARLDRAWALALGARGRAAVLAARGDLDGAEAAVDRALAEHARLQMPFERARTLLLLGQLQRRRRRRQAATQTLAEALGMFESCGAQLWAQRAREELARVSAAVGETDVLTPAERRVAERAAAGMSNKQIAAELFISPKTVETNLSSVYRKLGVRSRSQLHTRLTG
ncbi:AAA family ATPase [Mycolicibacterium brumae]|nr:AAA family ATPase [Mycolicibacterium brumae]RWA22260.1 hypothetical protein MBRU_13285 [Mycolicibacterium brumae DSM 44177]UWW07237.1 LuxR C-terminal-related transcriptional regulator [Mycolicibacterium brumae]